MHETPHGFFHLDQPADQTAHSAGPVKFQGWAAGTHGRPMVDLRIRLADGFVPVVYGFPRADLAAFFKLTAPFLPGGFEVTVNLAAGEHTLAFEALTIAGEWQPLASVRVSAQGQTPADAPPSTAILQSHEFARALRSLLRAVQPAPLAAASLADALPLPAVIRYAHLPFHGHLHQPTLLERVLFGRLRIEGWLFHETAAIRRVAATVDLQLWQDLTIAGTKPYVEAMFPQFRQAKNCRIDGLIDIPAQLPNPLCVRIYAELDDGTWHLCQVQQVHTWDQEQEKAPFVAFRHLHFIRCARALVRACRHRGFTVSYNRAFWSELGAVYRDYRARALPSAKKLVQLATTKPANPLRHVTLITHNLGLEGAPLFLCEFARHLAENGTRLHVVSAADGPLAAQYTRLGATVQILDVAALHQAANRRQQTAALAQLALNLPLVDTDLVIANTLSTWWGVHLAQRAAKPSLFYIHESTTPATFYLGHLPSAALSLIEQTFELATHVSFLTETTRIYYRPWLGPANHGILPGWIDVAAIDRALTTHRRATARHDLNLPANTRLVVNVGSVCDRKGQHIFVRGVDLLWRQAPALAATCRFLMIGGRDTLFDADLHQFLTQLDHPNLEIVPATDSPLRYYSAADLFVCSSYEESLPRVIMEAMACRVPILSTAVHGIRDLIEHDRHGWLIPPGHSQAIAEGLQAALSHPRADEITASARDRVTAYFDAAVLLPRHAALAATVAGAKSGVSPA